MHWFSSSSVRRAIPAPSIPDLPVDPRDQATLPNWVRKQCSPVSVWFGTRGVRALLSCPSGLPTGPLLADPIEDDVDGDPHQRQEQDDRIEIFHLDHRRPEHELVAEPVLA